MVRKVRQQVCLSLLAFLTATPLVVAQQPGPDQAAEQRSAYTRVAKRGRVVKPEFDRRRATQSLREISDHVAQMKRRTETATATQAFDPERAEETLQAVKSFVTEMKKRTKATRRTTSGPVEEVYVHRYNPVSVPTPQRIERASGLSHQELAERRLRAKGYVKTDAGWVPAQHRERIVQQYLKRKGQKSVAEAPSQDPF